MSDLAPSALGLARCKGLEPLVFNTKIPNRPEQVNKTIKCCTGCVNLKDNTLGDVYRELAAEVVERCTENEAEQTGTWF